MAFFKRYERKYIFCVNQTKNIIKIQNFVAYKKELRNSEVLVKITLVTKLSTTVKYICFVEMIRYDRHFYERTTIFKCIKHTLNC